MTPAQPAGDASAAQTNGEPPSGPTALRILLGAQLRRLRKASGVSRDDAGWAIRASYAKISRMEAGRVGFKARDVSDLLTLYGVSDEQERSIFLALVRQANTPGWWHKYSDILASWFEMYVGLEQAASIIRIYEVQFMPGLLQTEDYAREIVLLGAPGASDDEIDHRVSLRMQRQAVLTRPRAPKLWVAIDEAALRRPVGGPQVWRTQLQHLLAMAELPSVTVQIVPFHLGGHAAEGGPFTILRFSEPDLPDIVYVEQLTSALYLDKLIDVERYAAIMNRLCAQAESPAQSLEFLNGVLKAL